MRSDVVPRGNHVQTQFAHSNTKWVDSWVDSHSEVISDVHQQIQRWSSLGSEEIGIQTWIAAHSNMKCFGLRANQRSDAHPCAFEREVVLAPSRSAVSRILVHSNVKWFGLQADSCSDAILHVLEWKVSSPFSGWQHGSLGVFCSFFYFWWFWLYHEDFAD